MGDKSPKSTKKAANQKDAKNAGDKKKKSDADAAKQVVKTPKK